MKKLIVFALIASTALMSACGPKDPGLKDAYKNYFKMGVAVTGRNVSDSATAALILKEFNSITAENCMKPGEIKVIPVEYFENEECISIRIASTSLKITEKTIDIM